MSRIRREGSKEWRNRIGNKGDELRTEAAIAGGTQKDVSARKGSIAGIGVGFFGNLQHRKASDLIQGLRKGIRVTPEIQVFRTFRILAIVAEGNPLNAAGLVAADINSRDLPNYLDPTQYIQDTVGTKDRINRTSIDDLYLGWVESRNGVQATQEKIRRAIDDLRCQGIQLITDDLNTGVCVPAVVFGPVNARKRGGTTIGIFSFSHRNLQVRTAIVRHAQGIEIGIGNNGRITTEVQSVCRTVCENRSLRILEVADNLNTTVRQAARIRGDVGPFQNLLASR